MATLYWTCKNELLFGLMNGVGPSGAKYVPGQHHRVDVIAETHLYEDAKNGIRGVSDPHRRAQDMEPMYDPV